MAFFLNLVCFVLLLLLLVVVAVLCVVIYLYCYCDSKTSLKKHYLASFTGNKIVHLITSQKPHEVQVDVAIGSLKISKRYSNFSLASSSARYRLSVDATGELRQADAAMLPSPIYFFGHLFVSPRWVTCISYFLIIMLFFAIFKKKQKKKTPTITTTTTNTATSNAPLLLL